MKQNLYHRHQQQQTVSHVKDLDVRLMNLMIHLHLQHYFQVIGNNQILTNNAPFLKPSIMSFGLYLTILKMKFVLYEIEHLHYIILQRSTGIVRFVLVLFNICKSVTWHELCVSHRVC